MRPSRVAWLLLASAAVAWSGFVAFEPYYQISWCDVENIDATCRQTIFSRYGGWLLLLFAVPVCLCALPAVRRLESSSWLVASALVIGSLMALPTSDTPFASLAYFLPIGIVAMVVASFQSWYGRRHRIR